MATPHWQKLCGRLDSANTRQVHSNRPEYVSKLLFFLFQNFKVRFANLQFFATIKLIFDFIIAAGARSAEARTRREKIPFPFNPFPSRPVRAVWDFAKRRRRFAQNGFALISLWWCLLDKVEPSTSRIPTPTNCRPAGGNPAQRLASEVQMLRI